MCAREAAFAPASPVGPARRARPAVSPRRAPAATAGDAVPSSPATLVRSWANSRTISSTVDLSRRFISVLFLSHHCRRAAFAEKQLAALAEKYSISRRLLILSAGVHSSPGDLLPIPLVDAARHRGVDLSEERPCAAFEISDLEYYDFVVVVDRDVKEEVMRMAAAYAHKSGGHLYEWERKVRLLCNFERTMPDGASLSAGTPVDVPGLSDVPQMQMAMDLINSGCEAIIRSLVSAGL